jgi:uncharacterized protein YkwD
MRKGSLVAGACACILAIGTSLAAKMPAPSSSSLGVEPPNAFASRLLADHNAERDRMGAVRLTWSHQLAAEAQSWAERLARDNRMYHSDRATRHGAGENLWTGTAGYYSADDMVEGFLAERKYYKPGTFPEVSKSGSWEDVGHYTQVIWPGTQQVGCAVAHNRANDFLVCRYWPAGNVFGHSIG